MGNRRIGRKRLYGVEKKGQKVNLESGAGVASNITSATQHRQGQELITEIAIDLDGLTGADTDRDIIGGASASYITRLTKAKFGIVTEVRVVCVETITNTATDITGDVMSSLTTRVHVNVTEKSLNITGIISLNSLTNLRQSS